VNIIITGGSGFIGYHLTKRLLSEGHYVICVDNFLTGSKENVGQFSNSERFELINKDIMDLKIEDIKKPIDQIYNLACAASPPKYQLNPIHTINTNTIGVMKVLNIANEHNARILQASTSEVYGDPLIDEQSESYYGNVNTIGKRACYDEGKRISETIFSEYNRLYGTDIRIARIFNTYGEFMQPDDGRVITNFINQALTRQPLTIYGDGSQTRSFCYVSDLIEGLVFLMNSSLGYFGPVNLGNPEEVRVIDIANKILKITGKDSDMSFVDLPEDDPLQRKPDITKAQKFLDWTPVVSLEDGLFKVIEFYVIKNNN